MKVLQLGKFYPIIGGVEKVMWDIACGLNVSGCICDMLCADADGSEKQREVKEIPFDGEGKCIVLPALGKLAATMISPKMISWLRKHATGYDIIHVHHPDPMACLALRLSGYKRKVVLHWHSDILKQKFFLRLYKPLQGWLIRRADRIVCTSPVYAAGSTVLKDVQDKIAIVPIGVDPVRQDPEGAARIRAEFPGKKIIYSLGRLVGYKGYEYLIDAAAALDDSYVVVIGGEGPLHEKLAEKIEAMGLGDKVRLIGRVREEDFPAWFSACDLFCLSSIWKTEAFAIVQIEAMSCGKPVVATRIPGSGVSWVNEDGVSGINVEPEDSKALAEAIKAVCEGGYDAFCAGARARFERNFTRKGMIDNCLKLYEAL
ncbi:MAG: glycosyltransferase [Bacteroidia bacterium]|nr:glycosyltransferase [Bacteroidia bacterium]